jgi:hypothetical protein
MILATTSEASYLLLASAFLTPPRSTALSKPTRSRIAERALPMAFAMRMPTTRMTRNSTSLGTNRAIVLSPLSSAVRIRTSFFT